MLVNPTITAFLPSINPTKSKYFYQEILGLNLLAEDDFALVFEGGGVMLRITIVKQFNPHPFTTLGFKINNIGEQVTVLQKKGVQFIRYDYFKQDELGIWTAPSGAKIAWFEDPDGNLISLSEHP